MRWSLSGVGLECLHLVLSIILWTAEMRVWRLEGSEYWWSAALLYISSTSPVLSWARRSSEFWRHQDLLGDFEIHKYQATCFLQFVRKLSFNFIKLKKKYGKMANTTP